MSADRIVTFQLGSHVYAVQATDVIEILRSIPVTPVPRAPAIAGLINVRGQIISVFDLRKRLGAATDGTPMILLLRTADGPASVLVDKVGDVIHLDPTRLAPPPQTLPAQLRDLVLAAYPLPDRIVLVLAADRITQPEDDGAFS